MNVQVTISNHALTRAAKRGVSMQEIEEVLRRGRPVAAEFGRQARVLVFPYSKDWRGSYYAQKRVKVIYAVVSSAITVVTVISYYGSWRDET